MTNGTKAERIVNGVRFLRLISQQATAPLEQDLVLSGCMQVERFWIVTAISASCVPDVIREFAPQHVDYDGPLQAF